MKSASAFLHGSKSASLSAREELEEQGYCIVRGLADESARTTFLSQFGPLLPQYDGAYTREILFLRNIISIGPHTEVPVFSMPPRYLALYCHCQARCGGGHTSLADAFAFYDEQDAARQDLLQTVPMQFVTSGPGVPTPLTAEHRLMTNLPSGRRIFRFSHHCFYFGDTNSDVGTSHYALDKAPPAMQPLVEGITTWFERRQERILIPEGAMLIWDNHRMLHARGHYADARRHLTRYWVGDTA